MGFNAMQPGRVKWGDVILLVVALAVIVAAVIWAAA
jgi:hypothetical protein